MGMRVQDAMMQRFAELRYEPTEKRVRVVHGGEVVAETARAVLVWEPRRIVPTYAVPAEDVRADLVSAGPAHADTTRPVLHPGIPFSTHSTPGEVLDVQLGGKTCGGAAFRPSDPDLSGLVVLDFDAFDTWYEEAEEIFAHPRDPYHRVDARPSDRHVRVELDGEVLAESHRPVLVFETSLPPRFYLPAEDVVAPHVPSETRTACPYKGWASYWSFGRHTDLAWSYEDPLPDAARIKGLVSFWDELVDVVVEGTERGRPQTGFAQALKDEFGLE
jgi:uncharacterized protein (DUF427 family)